MSLRNSHTRGFDLKFRRTDQALHDTTQRFVESLYKDIRISQHADFVFAAKRFETEQWYWLTPLASGRTGFLVFQSRCPVVWIDDQFKQSYRIPMRVSFQVYERSSLMLASLDRVNGILRIEDCWTLAGDDIRSKSFTERWNSVHEFFDRMHRPDPTLQQGLQIEPAKYAPLSAALTWQPLPNLVFAQGETAPRRLRVYFQPKPEMREQPPLPSLPPPTKPTEEDPTNQHLAKAVPHPEYPDTYDLWIQGVKQGFAAVQDIELSRQLRLLAKTTKEMLVKIQWNEEFDMYEIIGLQDSRS